MPSSVTTTKGEAKRSSTRLFATARERGQSVRRSAGTAASWRTPTAFARRRAGRHLERGARTVAALEDAVLLLERREQPLMPRDGLRAAEQQHAAGQQRIVEGGDDGRLQLGVHVDQQVAAGHQVHAGERRVSHQAVRREGAEVAHLLGDDVAVLVAGEEAAPAFRRQAVQQRGGIAPGPGGADRRLVDVGGEDLHLGRVAQPVHVLAQQDGERVRLLAGGAAGHPDADVVPGALALEQPGHDDLLHRLERLGVAEERGDADQQVAEQQHRLLAVRLQPGDVGGQSARPSTCMRRCTRRRKVLSL